MGGQRGGMVNELGSWPEVCKKSVQAMVADMNGAIQPDFFERYSLPQLAEFSPKQLEDAGRLTSPLLYTQAEQHYQPIGWDDAMARISETPLNIEH